MLDENGGKLRIEVLENMRWRTEKEKLSRKGCDLRVENGSKKQEIPASKMGEDRCARIFLWFRNYNLQRQQGMQEGSTEEDEMKQQQRKKEGKL